MVKWDSPQSLDNLIGLLYSIIIEWMVSVTQASFDEPSHSHTFRHVSTDYYPVPD